MSLKVNAVLGIAMGSSEAGGYVDRKGNITTAPEMPGAIDFIRWLHQQGIIVSVGHSNATYEQVQEGIQAGLSHVTHIFNAMRGLHHREPGVVGAALSSTKLIVEMIADGIHLHPIVLKLSLIHISEPTRPY